MSPVELSVVIPCYQSAANLPDLMRGLLTQLDARFDSFEILLVNDASPDSTWITIEELSRGDHRVVGIDLLHNHGQPLATMCGLAASSGELVATMDDDGEHTPDQLIRLIDALVAEPDWDAVVGRWDRKRGVLRNIGTVIHSVSDTWAWGTPRRFDHTAFRVMRRPVRNALVEHPTTQPVIGPMLHRMAAHVHNVDVTHGSRSSGESGFTIREGIQRVVRNYTAGSTFPLVAMSATGIVFAFLSISVGLILLGRWVFGASPPAGWLSSILATTFLSGVILLCLGVLGQYVAFLVREANHSPTWNVRRTTNGLDNRWTRRSDDHG